MDAARPRPRGEAIDPLLQARRTFAEISYLDGAGYALHILGRCFLSLGRDAKALSCLQEALTSHRATGNRRRQAATLRSLGTAQSRVGQAAEASESRDQAAAIFTDLGDRAEAEEVRAEQAESGIS
jgi:tetratricopeptide (TPR) repeat protein